MTLRKPLRDQVTEAWTQAIESDFHRQRINSERGLQASLWSKLNEILPPDTRRLFIEPTLRAPFDDGKLDGADLRYPDLVICNAKEVIGIVELKYQPLAEPSWKKDLETFTWILDNREHISVQNLSLRYRGVEMDSRVYPLAKDVLFVWAGVHKSWSESLQSHIDERIGKHFLELHAETNDGEHPLLR
jgi:hypothetical protein